MMGRVEEDQGGFATRLSLRIWLLTIIYYVVSTGFSISRAYTII